MAAQLLLLDQDGSVKPCRGTADPLQMPSRAHKQQRLIPYQDAHWPRRARLLFGVLYPLGIVAVVAGALGGDSIGTESILAAVFAGLIIFCEWRTRRMGFTVTDDGVELIRALKRSFVPWGRIDRFVLRKPPGAVDYGQRVIWIKQSTKKGVLPKGPLPVPTLYVAPKDSRLFAWLGSNGVKRNGEIAPDPTASWKVCSRAIDPHPLRTAKQLVRLGFRFAPTAVARSRRRGVSYRIDHRTLPGPRRQRSDVG